MNAADGARELAGDAPAAMTPFTPSCTSSIAALSGPRTTTLGPGRRRLTHDEAVALAPRGQDEAHSPVEGVLNLTGGDGLAALLDSEVEGAVNVAAGEPLRIRDDVEALGEAARRRAART